MLTRVAIRRLLACWLLLWGWSTPLTSLAAPTAPADAVRAPALCVHLYRPSVHPGDLLALQASQVNRTLTVATEFVYGLQANPLVLESSGGPYDQYPARRQSIIRRMQTGDVTVALSFLGHLSVGLDLPAVLEQAGQSSGLVPLTGLRSAGIGDLRLSIKGMALDNFRQGFGLAFELATTAPTAQDGTWLGETNFTLAPRLIVDYNHFGVRVLFNAGYLVRFGDRVRLGAARVWDEAAGRYRNVGHPALETGDEVFFGVGGAWPFLGDRLEPLCELEAASRVNAFFQDPNTERLELRCALRYQGDRDLGFGLRLTAGAGVGLLQGYGNPPWRFVVGLGYMPRTLKPPDADKDGVADHLDECPREPEDRDGYFDTDGCPDADNDSDGVPDDADRCPNVAEDADNFNDSDGCPETDNDGDGIEDGVDLCRNAPEDFDQFEDDDGCPDYDNDMDGIPDAQDRCPNQPETRNFHDDEDGCPDGRPVSVGEESLVPESPIEFEPGSAAPTAGADPILDQIAKALNEHPEIKRLRIVVGSAEPGAKGAVQELTEQRAAAVREALVGRGVAVERLRSEGAGAQPESSVELLIEQREKSLRPSKRGKRPQP